MTNIYRKPQIENNWWRIVLYLFLCLVATLLFVIPVVAFFWDMIMEDNREALKSNFGYIAANQFVNMAAVVGASWLMIAQIEYRTFEFYRLTFKKKLLLNGFAIGVIAMVLYACLVYSLGSVEFEFVGFSKRLLATFSIYALVAVGEEVLVRGYILTNLQEKMNPFFALLISSLFFGSLHFGNDHFTWIGFTTISVSGFLMGLLTLKTGSISTAVGLHWSWNFVQGPILGFAVSGHQEIGILNPISMESDTFSGGKFGAEGSVLLMMLCVVSLFPICYFLFDKKFFFGSKRVFASSEFSDEK